ncbi:MAG: polysaccharide biosynthesis C-terminal domain-containing protein, partial [bacterium]|nr:polysaccharide biosynthesis C-terminal domain-containing protein [bacterium]
LWGYATVAVVTLVGYLIAIPVWSYWGAAWLTVASEIAIATITFRVVRRASGFRIALRIPAAALAASVIMAFVLLLAHEHHVIPRIALGAIVYGLVIFILPPTRRIVASSFSPTSRGGA